MPLEPAFGGLLINKQGRILLRKPKAEYDGYAWTFAKGRPNPNETPEQTALREVLEETGYKAKIVGRLPKSYEGSSTINKYFLMFPLEEVQAFGDETEEIRWVTGDMAEKLIGKSKNTQGCYRDWMVVRDAVKMALSMNIYIRSSTGI